MLKPVLIMTSWLTNSYFPGIEITAFLLPIVREFKNSIGALSGRKLKCALEKEGG